MLFSTNTRSRLSDNLAYAIDLAEATDDAWTQRYDVSDTTVQKRGVDVGVFSVGDIRSSMKTFANRGLGCRNSKSDNRTTLDSVGLWSRQRSELQ